MKKTIYKVITGMALAFMLSFAIHSFASAEQRPGDPSKRVAGKVAAVGSNSITIEKRDGAQETIAVTSDTEYSRNRQPASFSDFKVDDFIAAHGSRNDGGQFTAERVLGGDRPPRRGPRFRQFNGVAGQAQAIDTSAGTITVQGRDGNAQVIHTNANTEFHRNRQTASLQDFKAGDHVAAEGARDSDGRFIAARIFGGDQRARRTRTPRN